MAARPISTGRRLSGMRAPVRRAATDALEQSKNTAHAPWSWPVRGGLLRRGGRVPAYRKAGGRWISGARPLPRTGIPAENTRYEAARVFIAGGRCPALGTDGIGAGA